MFQYIRFPKLNINYDKKIIPTIRSKLWDHQSKTASKIINGMTIENRKGFGDASDVGSGKTLTSLSIFAGLLNFCVDNKLRIPNKGFIVLLPTDKLYDTWKTEITKHTKGFDVIDQKSDGSLTGKIKYNTILSNVMNIGPI